MRQSNEWTEETAEALGEVAYAIGTLNSGGLDLLQGIAMAIAGNGLHAPLSESVNSLASAVGELSMSVDQGCETIAKAIRESNR